MSEVLLEYCEFDPQAGNIARLQKKEEITKKIYDNGYHDLKHYQQTYVNYLFFIGVHKKCKDLILDQINALDQEVSGYILDGDNKDKELRKILQNKIQHQLNLIQSNANSVIKIINDFVYRSEDPKLEHDFYVRIISKNETNKPIFQCVAADANSMQFHAMGSTFSAVEKKFEHLGYEPIVDILLHSSQEIPEQWLKINKSMSLAITDLICPLHTKVTDINSKLSAFIDENASAKEKHIKLLQEYQKDGEDFITAVDKTIASMKKIIKRGDTTTDYCAANKYLQNNVEQMQNLKQEGLLLWDQVAQTASITIQRYNKFTQSVVQKHTSYVLPTIVPREFVDKVSQFVTCEREKELLLTTGRDLIKFYEPLIEEFGHYVIFDQDNDTKRTIEEIVTPRLEEQQKHIEDITGSLLSEEGDKYIATFRCITPNEKREYVRCDTQATLTSMYLDYAQKFNLEKHIKRDQDDWDGKCNKMFSIDFLYQKFNSLLDSKADQCDDVKDVFDTESLILSAGFVHEDVY